MATTTTEEQLRLSNIAILNKIYLVTNKYGTTPQSRTFNSPEQEIEFRNAWADYWFYFIGVNTIPALTQNKTMKKDFAWTKWQSEPIPDELFEKWKTNREFKDGLAIVCGQVWRGKNKGKFLVGIDADNLKAITEICTREGKTVSLQQIAAKFIVEQHKDNLQKAHFYFYSPKPFPKKSSDSARFSDKIFVNEIPAIEIKSLGEHGLMYCSPSINKGGYPYEIIGTLDPVTLNILQADELEHHMDNICKKYGLKYLENAKNGKSLIPIEEIYDDNTSIPAGHNRHEAILRFIESQIARNRTILDPDIIYDFCKQKNKKIGSPALSDREFERQWYDAIKFVSKQEQIEDINQLFIRDNEDNPEEIITNLIIRNRSVLGEGSIKELAKQQFARLTRDADFETVYKKAVRKVDRKKIENGTKRHQGSFQQGPRFCMK